MESVNEMYEAHVTVFAVMALLKVEVEVIRSSWWA